MNDEINNKIKALSENASNFVEGGYEYNGKDEIYIERFCHSTTHATLKELAEFIIKSMEVSDET